MKEQLEQIVNKNQKILVLLDGYDEYNNKGIKIFNEIIDLNEYKNVKVIMTVREKYAERSNYRYCFG